jgi:leucyl aminopeptidase
MIINTIKSKIRSQDGFFLGSGRNMSVKQGSMSLLLGVILPIVSVFAAPKAHYEQVQVPQCLASHFNGRYPVLAQNKAFALVHVPSAELPSIGRLADQVRCGHFKNVTHLLAKGRSAQSLLDENEHTGLQKSLVGTSTYQIQHPKEVHQAFEHLNVDEIWQTVHSLTSFENRSSTELLGVDAANWLKKTFDAMADASGRTDVQSFFVPTGRYKQPSLVAVLGENKAIPALVIGAHMDTYSGLMPGAGDDASGCAGIMEMARVLLNSNFVFKRPIYIIWYAAEERGLVGSQFVVDYFKSKKIPVKAVVQMDMIGYRPDDNDPTMWIYTDYTNSNLNQFMTKLIKKYIHVPVAYSACGYSCSDHASWDEQGIPAAFPCESSYEHHNPYIHSALDTESLLNTEHMVHFTQLAIAFALELALGTETVP